MKVEAARRTLSRLIGAKPAEIVFTSGGTESIATVFAQKWKAIVISTVEHSAVIQAARTAENRGITVFRAGVNRDGSLQEGVLRDCVEQARRVNGTGNVLVSLMLANNETGVIFPLEKLSGFIKKVDVYFHVDAVQCVGKIPVDVDTLNCDYLSLSAHKFHGLKGAGLLFRRHMAPLIPLIHGHQESGFRGGTENVVGIIAMAIAAKEVVEMGPSNRGMQQNRDSLEKQLMDSIPGLRIIGSGQHRLPNTSNMMFPRHDGTMLAEALSRRGLFVSTGSACSTGGQASHVLRAMGYSQREACLLYTSPSPRDRTRSRMPSSA